MRVLLLENHLNYPPLYFRACLLGVKKKLVRERSKRESLVVMVVERYATCKLYAVILWIIGFKYNFSFCIGGLQRKRPWDGNAWV